MTRKNKILSLAELKKALHQEKTKRKRIALCHGVFDLLHPGHIIHLQEARKLADCLVVTVTPDIYVRKGPGRPLFNEQLRLKTLAAMECVDYVALNQWPTAVETIKQLKPNVYVKGSDYANPSDDLTGKISEEQEAIHTVGGRIEFTDGEFFSSSSLINRFFSNFPEQTQKYLKSFRLRYSAGQIIDSLKRLNGVRVLVIGESILDEYCYCMPLAKVPKDPIVATKFASEESFAGGALANANHIAGFCNQVTLITALGSNEEQYQFIKSKLSPNVRFQCVRTPDRPTIVKRRFLEPTLLTKMFEVQYLDDTPIMAKAENKIESILKKELKRHDLVVVADFGHGLLTPRLREVLQNSKKFLAINTQSNSANLGYNPITQYERADYVCIDEPELRMASRNRFDAVPSIALKLKQLLKANMFCVTRGGRDTFIFSGTSKKSEISETPVLATKLVDRTGAGDAFFAVTSPLVYQKAPIDLIGFVGNCVGAMAVEIVCNREPVDPTSLYKFITHLLKH